MSQCLRLERRGDERAGEYGESVEASNEEPDEDAERTGGYDGRASESSQRAITPVVGVVLLAAVTVVAAAAVGLTAVGVTDRLVHPPPRMAVTSGPFTANTGLQGGVVRLTHAGGESVAVDELAFVVDATAACGKTGRLVGLPLGSGHDVEPANVEGSDVFDGQSVRRFGDPPHVLLQRRWRPGETVAFRLAYTDCPITDGDGIVVRVVHEPSGTVLERVPLLATGS